MGSRRLCFGRWLHQACLRRRMHVRRTLSERAPSDLTCHLERWIEQRTGGRVHKLSVETVGDRLVVHGYSGSYYVRQLALAAVFETLEAMDFEKPEQVDLDIEVRAN